MLLFCLRRYNALALPIVIKCIRTRTGSSIIRQQSDLVVLSRSANVLCGSGENNISLCFRGSHTSSSRIHNNGNIRRTISEYFHLLSMPTPTISLYRNAMIINYREFSDDNNTILMDKINNVPDVSNSSREPTRTSIRKSDSEYTNTTLEKRIMHLMEIFEIDDAINLLKESVSNGVDIDRTVLSQMLWEIADIGKVDCLLDLYESVLRENSLISSKKFYLCLGAAILSSGNVKQGFSYLAKRHEEGMDSRDVDVLFTVLATKIIEEFHYHMPFVESFVETMLARSPPIIPARAVLWKCFVLAGNFEQADVLRAEHVELKKLIPEQVTSIIHSSSPSYRMEFDKEAVLHWLIQQPYLSKGLRSSALHLLVQIKSDENDWRQAVQYITVATDNGVTPLRDTMVNFLSKFFDECSPEDELAFWKSVKDNLQTDEIKLDIDSDKNDS